MANEVAVRTNYLGGLIEDNPLTAGAATLTSAGLAFMPAIGTTQHMLLTLDPDGVGGAPETVMVTAHTGGASTATVTRGVKGSVARQHEAGVSWVHGPLADDSGVKLLAEVLLAAPATGIDITGIPAGYKDLVLKGRVRSDRAATTDGLQLQLGGAAVLDTTAGNYRWHNYILGDSNSENAGFTGVSVINMGTSVMTGATATAGAWGQLEISIFDYAVATYNRQVQGQTGGYMVTGTRRMSIFHGEWLNNADAVGQLRITPVNGPNLVAGSMLRLYGMA
jgi:hypothetical protein